MNGVADLDVDRALVLIRNVRTQLDRVYSVRESGLRPTPSKLQALERLIEDCASHEAFADQADFRKGY